VGQTLHLPDAPALAAIHPQPRFVCLIVLMALRDGADAVRFEHRQGVWVVSARRDKNWMSYAPAHEAADIPRTLRDLT
jgi:Protein of unknown function (DUF3024)